MRRLVTLLAIVCATSALAQTPIFPTPGGGVVGITGPNSSTPGDVACWANSGGTALSDCGTFPANRIYHSLDAGMVGDGVTNNNTTAQAWINNCISTTRICWLDAGQYLITTTLNITSGLTIRGNGGLVSMFNYTPTTGNILNDTSTAPLYLFDMGFQGPGTSSAGAAIYISPASGEQDHGYFQGVTCDGVYTCFDFEKAAYWHNYGTSCLAMTGECIIVANTNAPDSGDSSIVSLQCIYAATVNNANEDCIYQRSSGGLKITNSKMLNGFRGYEFLVDSGVGTGTINLSNNSIEDQYDSAIYFNQASSGSGTLVNIVIHGNEIEAVGNAIGIETATGASPNTWLTNLVVTGNVINANSGFAGSSTSKGIYMNNTSIYTQAGNSIWCGSAAGSTYGVLISSTVNDVATYANGTFGCATNFSNAATNSSNGN